MRTRTLLILRQNYRWLYADNTCLVPLDKVEPHLLTHSEGGVDGLDPKIFTDVHVCSLYDDDEWRAVGEWVIRNRRISRIVAPSERFLLLAAELRTKFGIDGMLTETAILFRDKVEMKSAVAALGITTPDFEVLNDPQQLTRIDWSAHPRVIKRRNFVGSMDVHIVESLAAAMRVWNSVQGGPGRYEIESYIEGDVIHCDSVIENCKVIFASAGRCITKPNEFHAGGICGSMLIRPGELLDRIRVVNERAVLGLGMRNGVTHLEMFHTPKGELIFCEVAARPGGGFITAMNHRCYSVNLNQMAILLEAGLPIPEVPAPNMATEVWGWIGLYPGGVRRDIAPEDFSQLGIVDHQHDSRAGDPDGNPRESADFTDQFLLSAPDEEEFIKRVDEIGSISFSRSNRVPIK